MDVEVPSFTIEGFLRYAELPEKDKDQLVQKYGELLKSNGLSEEKELSLLDIELLMRIGVLPIHAAAIVQAARNYRKKDLAEIINEVYKQKPDWKCILDVPEKPPVDIDLQWVGREKELSQLEQWAKENISHHLLQKKTKQMYLCPLVHGGLGVDKSRLVIHSNKRIEHILWTENPTFSLPNSLKTTFRDAFERIGHLFIDFSRKDVFGGHDVGLDVSTSLGLRIAAHFFFGVGCSELLGASILTEDQKKQFTFENVCSLISNRHCKSSTKHILLTIQLDEVSLVDKSVLNQMLNILTTHVTVNHDQRLCILPHLTGTGTDTGIKAISNSQLLPTPIIAL